jgi:hypothetical protein
MAGERLTKLTLEASFHISDGIRGNQTRQVRFKLGGVWVDYYRGAFTSQHQYVVPDPDDVGRDYVKQAVDNLLSLIRLDIQSRGLAYTVSNSRDMGNQLGTNQPRIQFDIEATQYSPALDLDFANPDPTGSVSGWTVITKLSTLQPIQVTQVVTNAGIYGSATGSIYLYVYGGNRQPFTLVWNDGVTGDFRQNLVAGTYTCVVTDQDGVSTTVTCVVGSDAQLTVLVQQTDTSITLVVSGGVAPYAVAWDDGPTVFARQNLAPGPYAATVTDSRGASQRVLVLLQPNRCYFSQNPVRLELDAGAAYRLNPATKPNLSFLAEVWVERDYLSGVYVQAGPQLEQPADPEGRTVFDVAALLDAYVSEHLPALDGPLVERTDQSFKRFYLKSGEKYGTPPVPAALLTAQVHFVLCGGLSPAEAAAGRWPAYQAAVKPFLTWEPDYQAVLPQQPAYLYYQHVVGADSLELWLRVRHTDGSSSQSVLTAFDANRWEVFSLNVSPAARGLTGPGIAGYDVWVASTTGTVLSQVRHFTLERAYYPQQRFFLYRNSLGGANVLAALGAAKLGLEVKAEEAERPTYDPDLGDVAVLDRRGTPTVGVITIPRRRAQVQADQELLLSKRVILVKDGQYWPGRVAAATFTVRDEGEGQAPLAFEFVLPKQGHFSPRLPLVVAGVPTVPAAGGEGATP